jgi:hypothetical protein
MKFVSARDLRLKPRNVWEQLKINKDIVITLNGKPIAILNETNEENFEYSLSVIRRSRALLAMEEMQQISKEKETSKLTEEDIEKEIKAVRLERQR